MHFWLEVHFRTQCRLSSYLWILVDLRYVWFVASMSGTLEFIDTADMTVMAQQEHFMASDVEWDPTGRYIMTGVSYWGYKFDNAYWIWSFQGRLLQKHSADRFCQFLWRPRPPSLVTAQQVKVVFFLLIFFKNVCSNTLYFKTGNQKEYQEIQRDVRNEGSYAINESLKGSYFLLICF